MLKKQLEKRKFIKDFKLSYYEDSISDFDSLGTEETKKDCEFHCGECSQEISSFEKDDHDRSYLLIPSETLLPPESKVDKLHIPIKTPASTIIQNTDKSFADKLKDIFIKHIKRISNELESDLLVFLSEEHLELPKCAQTFL